jgi:hypothetical protein
MVKSPANEKCEERLVPAAAGLKYITVMRMQVQHQRWHLLVYSMNDKNVTAGA